jgi:hypothetical protein
MLRLVPLGKRRQRLLTIALLAGLLSACCLAQSQLDQIWNKATGAQPADTTGTGLSNDRITAGLKEALTVSTGKAVAATGRKDGFLENEAIKILLPNKLRTAGKGMRLMGMGAQLDELEVGMNRAAEQATPLAKPIFINAVKKMSFADARKILSGGDTARRSTSRSRVQTN